jgi:hypothetical protein
MSYEEKFERVRSKILEDSKKIVIDNYQTQNNYFDMWLMADADMEFGNTYVNKFKEEFSDYMNSDIESLLWFAGKSIIFGIQGFLGYKEKPSLKDLLKFVESFISAQLDDFDNWCDDIILAFPSEEINEDNPN